MGIGIYRTTLVVIGGEYAVVIDGGGSVPTLTEVTRQQYEERRYKPPFEMLPTKAQFEAKSRKKISHPVSS